MSNRTTAAEILRRVFSKLDAAIPNINNGTLLFTSWSKVLGGDGRTEFNIVSSIADVLSVLDKLESQINSSHGLDNLLKSSAIGTMNVFKPLFSFQSMNLPASNFKNNCAPHTVGQLGIIGLSLKDEFSEPRLSADDNKIVVAKLKEVKELLKSPDLPVDLKMSLEKHIDGIIWWLSRPDMVSLQNIIEKTGSTIIISKQIEEKAATEECRSVGAKIRDGVASASKIVFKAMSFMVRNADNIEKLEGIYHGVIEGPSGS